MFHHEMVDDETAQQALTAALADRRYARLLEATIYTQRDLEPVPVGVTR